MLFQSLEFLIFFTVFFIIYRLISGNVRIRNFLLMAASLYLYSLWDTRFTAILVFIILVDFFSAKYADKDKRRGRYVFYTAVILNLIPLIFFKYYNFFADNFNSISSLFGLRVNITSMKLLLPVGISFYTFLSLSYLTDVYRKQIRHEKNIVDLAVSLSFFPIIMSGPIHRPRVLLEQIKSKISFSYDLAAEGMRQILTGLFYKVVIADNIARYADETFSKGLSSDGLTLLLGSVYFTFQLYFDFNGYSEMAIGVSKLLGIRINRNFRYPYLSRTISDFWKRWHISLTEWFRDYIFLPLSYIVSRRVKQGSFLDKDIFIYASGIIVTWTLTGLWHGAGWNYIVWGMIHGSLLIANKAFSRTRKRMIKKAGLKKNSLPVIIYESALTFIFVNFAWIFFRSETAGKALAIWGRIFELPGWKIPDMPLMPLILISLTILLESVQRNREFLFDIPRWKTFVRWPVYIIITMLVLYYSGNDSSFIYMGF